MSFFLKGKEVEVVLFSPLKGKITNEDKPVVNATIKLWIAWKDKEGETEIYHTDEQGNFSIPQKSMTYKESPLAQLVIKQQIIVIFEGKETIIWRISKMEEGAYTELGGEPMKFTCDLTNEEKTVRGIRSLGGTMCTWESLKGVGD